MPPDAPVTSTLLIYRTSLLPCGVKLAQERFCAIDLIERLANDRRVYRDRSIVRPIEPVMAGDGVNVAVEHQSDDFAAGVDQRTARIAAHDVAGGRNAEWRAHIQLILHLHPAIGDFER